jgi:hypothetical protein
VNGRAFLAAIVLSAGSALAAEPELGLTFAQPNGGINLVLVIASFAF